jgi:outer membrane protein OmpA-like peptidoglycan-associated protein
MSMEYRIRLTIIGAILSLLAAGCIATHEWTQDLLGKRQAELDDRVVKVEIGVREHGERLDRVETRVSDLETRSVRKGGSPEKANTPVPRGAAHRSLIEVIIIPFAFDSADLNTTAEAALATLVTEVRETPRMTLDLEGTTDPVGRLDYNVKLSARRVEAVKRWLVQQGIEPARIISSTARGPLLDHSVKNNLKRRVIVKLMRSTE